MNININKLKNSKDLALFLGMFIGDGCLSNKKNGSGFRIYPISFFNTNRKLVELFGVLFKKIFGLNGKIRGNKREKKKLLWGFEKYSVEAYKIVNNEFEVPSGKKSSIVRIPSFILHGNNNLKKFFFLGLLITDGGIKKGGDIIFHLASKGLLYDLQKLIVDVWGFKRPVKSYIQRNKFRSYQLTLNKHQSSTILLDLPRSHNLVLR